LLEMLLDLYECPAYDKADQTVTRGRTTIRDAYISFFCASTPILMHPFFANRQLWHSGLFARFLMVTAHDLLPYAFYPREVHGLDQVANGLRRIYERFPIPVAEIVADEDREGHVEYRVAVAGHHPPEQIVLEAGVWEAWEAYGRATGRTLITPPSTVDPDLHPSYGRLATQVMKVAMLLAAMDSIEGPVCVTRAHFARAQHFVEVCRADLHLIHTQQAQSEDEVIAERILDKLARPSPDGHTGWTVRELNQYTKVAADRLEMVLRVLRESGLVATDPASQRTTRWVRLTNQDV
jgi:hypothetical protein